MTMRAIAVAFVMLGLLAGCSSKRRPDAAVPVLAAEAPPVSLGPETQPEPAGPVPQEAEPVPGSERVVVPPLRPSPPREPGTETAIEQTPDNGAVLPQSPRTPLPTAPPKTPEAQIETDPVRTEPRPPSLRPMISDAERRRLEIQTQGHIERAKRNLAGIQEGRLEANERTALQEARSILARAEQLRQSDPPLSNSLAERAAILSQELLRKQR